MNGSYQSGRKVFLTGENIHLIKKAAVPKYAGCFYTICFENSGDIKIRESRISPS